jgi:hypothetical protein
LHYYAPDVMVVSKSGVSKLMKEKLPSLIVWH